MSLRWQYLPSVLPHHTFDPRADADALEKAMKGFGTDEKGLINILCKRTSDQRVKITQAYKAGYGKVCLLWNYNHVSFKASLLQDLAAKIKSETSGNFEKVLVALTQSRAEFLARELYKAMDGLGTNESTLIQILCSSTNQEIRDINLAYVKSIALCIFLLFRIHGIFHLVYGKPMERDIKDDTSGTFRMLLVSLVQVIFW